MCGLLGMLAATGNVDKYVDALERSLPCIRHPGPDPAAEGGDRGLAVGAGDGDAGLGLGAVEAARGDGVGPAHVARGHQHRRGAGVAGPRPA